MTSYLKVSKWSPDLRRSRCRCRDAENQLVAWQEKRTRCGRFNKRAGCPG